MPQNRQILPAGQGKHVPFPAWLKCPSEQEVGLENASMHWLPAGQGMQVASPCYKKY